ncbi:hypothetical protein Pmani_021893 [Petrolisthes manimaculis]|uniref:Major facilitator superfamily associated domain-containing protein n=1 Tax=Petrolisthes manimaculis TaxID=1843537 RepID=A0AAE1PDZ1_9EUCA|nr:hypothetical protein Pmani_021893 [Petrolisthes manimaculis]
MKTATARPSSRNRLSGEVVEIYISEGRGVATCRPCTVYHSLWLYNDGRTLSLPFTAMCEKTNEEEEEKRKQEGDEGTEKTKQQQQQKEGEEKEKDGVGADQKKARKNGGKPQWVTRVLADLKRKEFAALKILFFLLIGAMMSLFPFLTLQARSLGITERELSILFALSPIVAIIGPPLTGIIADRIGNFKILLSVLMGLSGVVSLGYLAVPEARRVVPLPSHLPYTLITTTLDPSLTTTLTTTLDPSLTTTLDPSLTTTNTTPSVSLTLNSPHRCDYQSNIDVFSLNIAHCFLSSLCTTEPGNETVQWTADNNVTVMTNVEVKVVRGTLETSTTTTNTSLQVIAWPPPNLQVNGSVNNDGECLICYGWAPSQDLCTNTNTTQELDITATFFSFMCVRLFNGVMLAVSHTMFQGATMAILREFNGDYGLQRLYANLGAIVMTPLSGYLIDVFSNMNGFQDFRPAFVLFFVLKAAAALVILTMNLDFRMPSNQVTKDVKVLLRNPEVLTLLMVMLITGVFFGLLDTFLFWLLQDLGAKKSLMGITVTVGTVAGIPILVASKSIIRKLGHANTIVLSLAFYVIRMIGYSYLTNPWWCMPFETLECFTVSLLGTAAVLYTDVLATPNTIATLQGMAMGIHHGIGRAIGSLVGGFLIAPIGIRATFRLAAGVSAITCIIYFILNRVFFHKQQLERQKKSAKAPQTNGEVVDVESNIVENSKDTSSDVGNSKAVKREYSNPVFEKD